MTIAAPTLDNVDLIIIASALRKAKEKAFFADVGRAYATALDRVEAIMKDTQAHRMVGRLP